MGKGKFYLTTAIPYVNARPHLGHSQEYVIADSIHRYQELIGNRVFFASGADENALKNVLAAEKQGRDPASFIKEHSDRFENFFQLLSIELDVFRRSTDQKRHWPGVQKLWKLCEAAGDIYKKHYKGLYCVGCESFKQEKDLEDGKCPDHDIIPELVKEENYFFRLSNYQDRLENLISQDKLFIIPQKRKREVLSFIESGLEDFSISRSNDRARGVGVPVPGDKTQKIYVWFDALTIYMTGVGFGWDMKLWKKWWPADLHIIGKDIARFHGVYWPAILLSAKLPIPKQLLIHGFITSGGRKMSKSIGNVIDPYEVLDKYGLEAMRYLLLREVPTLDDGDFTYRRLEELYNSDLANGLGNLVSRVAKLCEKSTFEFQADEVPGFRSEVVKRIEAFRLDLALSEIWKRIRMVDKKIEEERPWNLEGKRLKSVLVELVAHLKQIGFELQPFMPETAARIIKQFSNAKIISEDPLFPRLKLKI